MAKYVSLSAIGRDKVGIVSAITEVLYKCSANIEDSTMTILHGQFAMILIIKIDDKEEKKLYSLVKAKAKKLSLNVSFYDVGKTKPKKQSSHNTYIISVYGTDKVGIVYKVSELLSAHKVNISDVQTKTISNKTYIMLIEVDLGKKVSVDKLKKDLKDLSENLKVNISLNQAEPQEL